MTPGRSAVVRVVAAGAVLGIGLAVAAILFLQLTGAMHPVSGPSGTPRALMGLFAANVTVAVMLIAGVVLAPLVATTAAYRPGPAAVAAALAHLALVAAGGVVLLVGIELLGSEAATPVPPASTPAASASPSAMIGGSEACEETFGEDSPLCAGTPTAPTLPGVEQTAPSYDHFVRSATVARAGIGAIPAAFVAAGISLVAGHARRREAL